MKENVKYAESIMRFSLVASLFLCILSTNLMAQGSSSTLPSKQEVQQAIYKATNYLSKSIQENGRMDYLVNMNPSVSVASSYNILRHAGSIYALAHSYSREADPLTLLGLQKACTYLVEQTLFPLTDLKEVAAIWSLPDINLSNGPMQAKLGGTGLGLVALLSMEKIQPGFTPAQDFRELGRFLLYMQRQNGEFFSKYIPEKGGKDATFKSLYYPGEAALGLVMLYEYDNDPLWLRQAELALTFLAYSRKDDNWVPADHWALLATQRLLQAQVDDSKVKIDSTILVQHAIQICRSILKEQLQEHSYPEFAGGFEKEGRTTPTATRLEGLLAAMQIIPEAEPIHAEIAVAIHQGIQFLLNTQVDSGLFEGAIPRAVRQLPGATDTFNQRATEVRIDYVQHALSAFLQYLEWVE